MAAWGSHFFPGNTILHALFRTIPPPFSRCPCQHRRKYITYISWVRGRFHSEAPPFYCYIFREVSFRMFPSVGPYLDFAPRRDTTPCLFPFSTAVLRPHLGPPGNEMFILFPYLFHLSFAFPPPCGIYRGCIRALSVDVNRSHNSNATQKEPP